jgi:hypothetical protein
MAFPAKGVDMQKQEIVAKAEMLIRSPVVKVFEAFVETANIDPGLHGPATGRRPFVG